MLQLIRLFQQRYEVHFASSASKSEYSYALNESGITEHPILLNDSSFDHFVEALQPDIVIFDRFMIEEQYGWRVAKHCPQALRILDTEDLHFLRTARLEAYRKNSPIDIHSDMALREIASIYRSDLSLIISEAEMRCLKNEFHIDDKLLHFLPFTENPISEEQQASRLPFEERKDFVFIGNFIHEPNWKTVEVLKNVIWPRLRQALPHAELHIYGAYAPQKALQLHKPAERFWIKGRADDARSTLERYRVLLAPIPVGAGLKGKFVDAMSSGTPTVSSTIGAEGMARENLWNGYITDDEEDFVHKAVTLYQDRTAWIQAQQNGYMLFNSSFANHPNASGLLDRCDGLHNHIDMHRRQNFIGRMLQHHSMQSTRYMSLWIEEKNKKAY